MNERSEQLVQLHSCHRRQDRLAEHAVEVLDLVSEQMDDDWVDVLLLEQSLLVLDECQLGLLRPLHGTALILLTYSHI